MASTSEHTSDNVNRKEGGDEQEKEKNVSTSSIDSEHGEQRQNETTIDDLNQLHKTDTLSAMQSSNENNKSDQTTPESDSSTKNNIVASSTTSNQQTKEESPATSGSSDSNKDDHDEKKQDQLTATTSSSLIRSDDADKNKAFSIEKDDEQHLTDFQRQKAKYFFNVNLGMLLLSNTENLQSNQLCFSFKTLKIKNMSHGKMWNSIYSYVSY